MLQEKESAKTNKKKKFYQKKVDRDAKKRYWQIPLDEKSSKLTTMNTPFGRYKLLILAFGIHSAQQVFHRIINGSFIDIVGVETDINDFLIWGKNTEGHNRSLIASCGRAKKIELIMNVKCKFNADELMYLSHKTSARGIELDHAKIKAIMEMPEPSDKKEIQRLLGFFNYVAENYQKLQVHWENYCRKMYIGTGKNIIRNHLRMSRSCYLQIHV